MHLTVIAYASRLDVFFEHVAFAAVPSREHHFARCQSLLQLEYELVRVGRPVTVLDVLGHGSPGTQALGDDSVVTPAPASWAAFASLVAPHLSAEGKVRLLGCNTGLGDAGAQMLLGLSEALSGREVLGTIRQAVRQDFGADGLIPEVEPRLLISSRELRRGTPQVG